jgi:hypothetical protein
MEIFLAADGLVAVVEKTMSPLIFDDVFEIGKPSMGFLVCRAAGFVKRSLLF